MNKIDIIIKEIKCQESINNLENNYLEINFDGKDVNYQILNIIRRILLRYIPIYAFDSNLIKIKKNNSVLNNDMLKLRLNNLPVLLSNLKNNLNKEDNINKIYDLENKKFNYNDENSIMMYINAKNLENEIKHITTNDVEFKMNDGSIIESNTLYKRPILLISLRKDEEVILTAKTSLNISLNDGKWLALKTPCNYIENNENNYNMIIRSRRQITEKECLKRGIKIILNKIKLIEENIVTEINKIKKKNNIKEIYEGDILIQDEDSSYGNIITYYLQLDKNIEFAGYKVESYLKMDIIISFKTLNVDIIKIFNDIIEKLLNLFNNIYKQIEKL